VCLNTAKGPNAGDICRSPAIASHTCCEYMGVNHGGTRPPRICTGGAAMMFVPQNSAHINTMYLTTRYAVYLYLFAQGIMYYTAVNTVSVWSSHLEWLPEYQNPQKSLGRWGFAPDPSGKLTALPIIPSWWGGGTVLSLFQLCWEPTHLDLARGV